MNAQASIIVNADPVETLECAYRTLLSMILPKDASKGFARINTKLLFASVSGKFKPTGCTPWKHVCMITIKRIDNSSCELKIVSDRDLAREVSTESIALISDFFELLSQNLNL